MIDQQELSKATVAVLASGSLIKGSPEQDKLHKALARFQADVSNPAKNCEAIVRGQTKDGKPFNYSFKYADLSEVLSTIRPIAGRYGLGFTQVISRDGPSLILITRVFYEEQFIESEVPLPMGIADIQKWGASISFVKRYTLLALLGIAGEDDPDGDAVEESPDARMKTAKAAADAEETQIRKYKELFSSAENLEQLHDLSKRHADLIGKFSSGGKAALRRHIQETERRFKSASVNNEGNPQ